MSKPLPWFSNEPKGLMLEGWFLSVMADPELDKGQVKIAWALTFLFNSKTGKAWAGNDTIGHAVGLQPETVRRAIGGLVSRGHLSRTRELSKGTSLRVLQPLLANQRDILRVGDRPPSATRSRPLGGARSPRQVGDRAPPKAGDGPPHILRGDPLNDPGGVEDMAPGSERPEAEDVFDEEIDLPF